MVEVVAAALATLTVEPRPAKSAAAVASTPGTTITNDIPGLQLGATIRVQQSVARLSDSLHGISRH